MNIYAKRSLNGLIQLWATIVLPPLLILVYLIIINFDFSQFDVSYYIIGGILLAASILYLVLFGKTLLLPDIVIEGDNDILHIHKRKHLDEEVYIHDIVDIIAVKNARMTFLRLSTVNRSYGKLTIKTMNKTYELYPVAKVDEVKKVLDKRYQTKK